MQSWNQSTFETIWQFSSFGLFVSFRLLGSLGSFGPFGLFGSLRPFGPYRPFRKVFWTVDLLICFDQAHPKVKSIQIERVLGGHWVWSTMQNFCIGPLSDSNLQQRLSAGYEFDALPTEPSRFACWMFANKFYLNLLHLSQPLSNP